MKIRTFKHGVGNGWELNFIGKVYNLRIARHQIAFWKYNEPIFQWLSKAAIG
jgi:hypothetical protein